MMTPRAIIYTRVSTGTQAEHGTSLAEQLAACQKKAEQLQLPVAACYEDPGFSGELYWARPGMQAALKDLEEGKADTLIISNLSRFSRDREHQSAIKKRVETAGGRLVFCDMTFENTPEGELMFNITGDFAQYERQLTRKRTMDGRKRRAEEGQQPSRAYVPFGYIIGTKEGVLTGKYPPEQLGRYMVNEDQAPWVKVIYQDYATGQSLREICRRLQWAGVAPPHHGEIWWPNTIKSILTNPLYKGCPIYGRMQRRLDEARLQRGLKRADYLVPADPANYVYLSATALVDSDLWERCQQRLIENKEMLAGNPTRKYLLSGLVRCPVCGRAMKSRSKKSGVYYQCLEGKPGRLAAGSSCQPTHYRADVIEQLTIRAIREVVRRPVLVTAALRAYSSQSDDEAVGSREKLRAELNELHPREKATVQAQIAGIQAGADPKVYAELLAQIAARRKALQTRLVSLEKTRKDIHSEVANLTQAMRDVDTILEAKEDELSTQEKRAFLSRIIKAIHPSAQGYTIVLPPLTREEGDTAPCMSAY